MNWIKVMCNILDHRKVKMLRKCPEGNTLVLLWLLMLAEAGKCNRGGYLMVSDSLPYSAETLSMVTDISLPTVQLGLTTFAKLEMIDQLDGAIFIKNWGKYQSQDKLEARRQSDRLRQQRHRQIEREKMRVLAVQDLEARDSHEDMSRDVTPENRQDHNKREKTTKDVRLLLSGTPLSSASDHELMELSKRHGIDRLLLVADVAAETWRRYREKVDNPGGYLQSLCTSLIVPSWYVPVLDRMSLEESVLQQKKTSEMEEKALKAHEQEQLAAKNELWESLSEMQREKYLSAANFEVPAGIVPPVIALTAIAKRLAWDAVRPCTHVFES